MTDRTDTDSDAPLLARLPWARVLYLGSFALALALMFWPTSHHDTTPDGRVKITYWEKWSGFELEAIQDCVRHYNQTQGRRDGVFVVLVNQGDIEQKVKIATAGGNPPDLVGLYSFNVCSYADQSALRPLDDILDRFGIGPKRYIPSYWRLCRHRGQTWCLPTAPATLALYWNKKLFRQAGLDPDRPPRTLDELDAMAHKLTRTDPHTGELTAVGFLPNEPGWWGYGWAFWFGGRLWNGRDAITATGPANVRALQWVRSYVDRYGHDRLVRFKGGLGQFSSADNGFLTGRVAMELQGVWFPNFIERYAPKDFEYGVAPFPAAVAGLANVTIAEADVIGIPRGARHVREAACFLRYIASPDGIELLCRGQGKHSPLRHTSNGFLDPARHPNPHVELFWKLAFSPNACRTPPLGVWGEYRRAMHLAFDQVWNAQRTPREALESVQQRIAARYRHERRRAKRLGWP